MMKSFRDIAELSEVIAYQTGCVLTTISFVSVEDGWRIMLKVKDTKGSPMVSFVFAPTIEDGINLIHAAVHTTSVSLKWKEDKYFRG